MKVKKVIFSIILVILIVLLLPLTSITSHAAEPIGYWTDEENISGPPPYDSLTKTYSISTAGQLAWLANEINTIGSPYSGYIFKLSADIDLAGHFWVPIGTFTPSQKYFSYTFDGNGKTISNMTIGTQIYPSTLKEIGLFGYVYGATIKDLNLANISVYAELGDSRIMGGGLVGQGLGSTITGVSVSGVINVSSTSPYMSGLGGIAGVLSSSGMSPNFIFSKVVNCSSEVSIIARGLYISAGGLIGDCKDSYITKCYSTQDILGEGAKYAGGLIGLAGNKGKITDSYALGDVIGSSDTDSGGLIGHSYFDVESCFALGNVTGCFVGGGLIGYGRMGNINNSFAVGNVLGAGPVGGLIGFSYYEGLNSVNNCYASGNIETTQTMPINQYAGGLLGYINPAKGTVITNSYWNINAEQTLNLVKRDSDSKVGIDRITDVSIAKSLNEMTDASFADLLNENRGDARTWNSVSSMNKGLPYLDGLYYVTPTYTVIFNSNGGSEVDPIAGISNGDTLTLPSNPTRAGYIFTGWNKEEMGTGLDFDITTSITSNITVYAQWIEVPKLISSLNNDIYVGGSITLTPNINGGTWTWDKDFFTATFNSPATFTALKAGSTSITYTVEGVSVTYDVSIEAGILPSTGQFFPSFIIGLGTIVLMTIMTLFSKKRKKT